MTELLLLSTTLRAHVCITKYQTSRRAVKCVTVQLTIQLKFVQYHHWSQDPTYLNRSRFYGRIPLYQNIISNGLVHNIVN